MEAFKTLPLLILCLCSFFFLRNLNANDKVSFDGASLCNTVYPQVVGPRSYYWLRRMRLLKPIKGQRRPEEAPLLRKIFNPMSSSLARHSESKTGTQLEPTLIAKVLIVGPVTLAIKNIYASLTKDTALDAERLQKKIAQTVAMHNNEREYELLLKYHPDFAEQRRLEADKKISHGIAIEKVQEYVRESNLALQSLASDLNVVANDDDYKVALNIISNKDSIQNRQENLDSLSDGAKGVLRRILRLQNGEAPEVSAYLSEQELSKYFSESSFLIGEKTPHDLRPKDLESLRRLDQITSKMLEKRILRRLVWERMIGVETGTEETNEFFLNKKTQLMSGISPEKLNKSVEDWLMYRFLFEIWPILDVAPIHPVTGSRLRFEDLIE